MPALNLRNTSSIFATLPVLVGLLGGCSSFSLPEIPVPPLPSFIKPYRMEIQQGNFITQEMLSQLRPGMTRDQVRFVLGSPLLADMFHADRWEYVFQRQLEYNKGFEQRNVTVFFEDGKLKRIAGDVVPAPSTPVVPGGAPVMNEKEAEKK